MWTMTEDEFQAAICLPAPERYAFFVEKVVAWEQVWSLSKGEEWVLAENDDGHEAVPVWPHPAFAASCAVGEWEGNVPTMIELADWLEKWLPGMAEDDRLVAVFPTSLEIAVFVSPEQHAEDIEDELET